MTHPAVRIARALGYGAWGAAGYSMLMHFFGIHPHWLDTGFVAFSIFLAALPAKERIVDPQRGLRDGQ